MNKRILITGGAGFIGSHLCQALLARGYLVRVLDSLIEQAHPPGSALDPVIDEVELLRGDVRDASLLSRALRGTDAVVHLAAEVGVGQSMYEIERYVSANDCGTAALLQALVAHPVPRLVVASSMSIYGEGLYADAAGAIVQDAARAARRHAWQGWDPVGADGAALRPLPTPEWKQPSLASVYAITKFVQERLVMTVAPAYGIAPVALRLFNVYGPGQALSNPYTGVLAIFAARLLNNQPPKVFEDGAQQRDFVHVEDVARAFVMAIEGPATGVFNIGGGRSYTVREVAERLAAAMGRPHVAPHMLGQARAGDIRHCFADIALAREALGFVPRRDMTESLPELAEWVRRQTATDRVEQAGQELAQRGLVA